MEMVPAASSAQVCAMAGLFDQVMGFDAGVTEHQPSPRPQSEAKLKPSKGVSLFDELIKLSERLVE